MRASDKRERLRRIIPVLAVAATLLPAASPRAGRADTGVPARGVKVSAEVLNITCERAAGAAKCRIDLGLTMVNTGDEPIIILKPLNGDESKIWMGGAIIYRTHGATAAAKGDVSEDIIHAEGHWPSIYNTPENIALSKRLDSPAPPGELTTVLPVNGRWQFKQQVQVYFPKPAELSGFSQKRSTWEQVRQSPHPLWMRVSFQLWPFNVENFQRNLAGLTKRWRRVGHLLLDKDEDGNYGMPIFTSEPVELDLSGAS